MQNTRQSSHPVISQTVNNTTLWIGHLHADPNDHLAGQTFSCPNDSLINNIQVFSAIVQQPGDLSLTLHEFDPESKNWGPSIANATLSLERGDVSKWISFTLQPVELKKNAAYGFRLRSDNGLIGIGEAASQAHRPFVFGQEWKGDSDTGKGNFYRYFSLAFKVGLSA